MKLIKYINSLNILSLALVCILGASGLLMSCEEEDTMGSEVVLLSYGPSGVKHGDTIKFIGLNLDKVSAIVLQPEIEITDFLTKSSTLIEITVPKAAQAGLVTLKTKDGDIETKSPLSFEVPVTITSITAEARPGSTITVTGDLLNWVESVTFKDGLLVEEFVSQSLTELVVEVPMEAQTGFLIFSSGGTDPLTFASENELVVTLPAVTSLSPTAVRHTENLTINGTDLDLVTSIGFGGDLTVTKDNFVSQAASKIVVAVPAMTLKGTLTLNQLSPVSVVTSQSLTIVLPIGTAAAPAVAVPGVDNLTITGTDLDLVAQLSLPSVDPIAAANFVSHSPTEIVLSVPEGTKSGGITYTTIHGYSANLGVNVVVPGAGPAPLGLTLYDDEVFFGGGDWSWNTDVSDNASTEQFYSGSKSWKYSTASDGGVSAGGMSGVDATGMNVFAFSIYGGPGTDGASLAAILGSDGADVWGNYNSVTISEGEWTEFEIDLANYPDVNLANVTRWIFKVEGVTGTTIYVDRVGFDLGGPKPLAIDMFDESVNFGGGDWSWNTDVSDNANTEQAYAGSVSWKFSTASDGGVSAGGMTGVDASGMSVLSFAIYGGPGTNGASVAAILGSDGSDVWGNYNAVTITEGAWTEFNLDLSNYPDVNLANVTRWIFKVEGVTGTTIYVDRVGFN